MTVAELIEKLKEMPQDAKVEHEYVVVGSVDYDEEMNTVVLHIHD